MYVHTKTSQVYISLFSSVVLCVLRDHGDMVVVTPHAEGLRRPSCIWDTYPLAGGGVLPSWYGGTHHGIRKRGWVQDNMRPYKLPSPDPQR